MEPRRGWLCCSLARAGGYFGSDEQFAPLIRGRTAYTGHMLITT